MARAGMAGNLFRVYPKVVKGSKRRTLICKDLRGRETFIKSLIKHTFFYSRIMLKKCSRYTADPSAFMAHMATALAVAVQIGNAQMVLAATHTWWENGVRLTDARKKEDRQQEDTPICFSGFNLSPQQNPYIYRLRR